MSGVKWEVICRLYPEKNLSKQEGKEEVRLDPELDGESLDPSDYDECLYPMSSDAVLSTPMQ